MRLILCKSKKLPIGTERNWKGMRWRKISEKKWSPVKKVGDYWYRDIKTGKVDKKKMQMPLEEVKKKKMKQFLRDYHTYKRGRDTKVIVDPSESFHFAILTPAKVLKMRADEGLMNKFIFDNEGYVNNAAYRSFNPKNSQNVGVDDLKQMVRWGMYNSVKNFDLKKKFTTPEVFMGYMKNAVNKNLQWIKTRANRKTVEERGQVLPSLNDPLPGKSGERFMEREERIAAGPSMISEQFVDFKDAVRHMKKGLSKKAKSVVDMMIEGGMKKHEMAKKLKMSPAAISKIINEQLKPLAHKFLMKSTQWSKFLKRLESFSQ